jgi:Zn-dependent peptidase ImmA (M78 family)
MKDQMEKIRTFLTKAPVPVEQILRNLGAEVERDARLPAGISGQIKRVGDTFKVSSSNAEHYFRQRFTLAHELGHLVLHRSLIGEGVDDDTKYRSTDTTFYNSNIDIDHERQANSFAASLLMPEDLLLKEIEGHEAAGRRPSLHDLYVKFQVSASAMTWRIQHLRLIERVTMPEQ